MKRYFIFPLLAVVMVVSSAKAETIGITGAPIYITKQDCQILTRHKPSADIAYKPGVDVRGRSVAPADLGGQGSMLDHLFPDGKVRFEIVVNPMDYGNGQNGAGRPQPRPLPSDARRTQNHQRYDNTTLPVARVDVDLSSGEVRLNGQVLGAEQDRLLRETCRKAGY